MPNPKPRHRCILSKHKPFYNINFVQCWPMSKTLGRRCPNVYRSLCLLGLYQTKYLVWNFNVAWIFRKHIYQKSMFLSYVWPALHFKKSCLLTSDCLIFVSKYKKPSIKVVSRCRDPQFLVIENYSYLFILIPSICKSWCLNTHFIPNNCHLTCEKTIENEYSLD